MQSCGPSGIEFETSALECRSDRLFAVNDLS